MSENPYEAPQANEPLPVASVVFHVPPEFKVLSLGSANCAGAGRLYLIGTLAAGVFVLCQFGMDQGQRENPWLILPMLFCLVACVVLFGWGLLKNLTGLMQLRKQLPKSNDVYTACLHACWIKGPVYLLLFFKKDYYPSFTLAHTLQEHVPNLGVITIWILTIYWHTRGLNSLVQLLGIAWPRYTSMMYWLSGVALTLAIVWTLYWLRWPQEMVWYLVLISCMALHFLAYARAYQQVSTVFLTGMAR